MGNEDAMGGEGWDTIGDGSYINISDLKYPRGTVYFDSSAVVTATFPSDLEPYMAHFTDWD